MEKLTNLPGITIRMTQLHTQFFAHLIHLPTYDPVHSLWRSSPFMAYVNSQLYRDLVPIGSSHPSKRKLNQLLFHYAVSQHSPHLLCSYIRFQKHRYDPLFNEPSRETQLAALRWRRNAFRPTEFICPVEGGYLSRSHVNHLLYIFIEPLLSQRMRDKWIEEQQDYPDFKYTILDFLLNHQLYDAFMDGVFIAFNVEG